MEDTTDILVNTEIKQCIVARNDLTMRKGKLAAQCCHASISFLRDFVISSVYSETKSIKAVELDWLEQGMKKVCCRVDSEEELMKIYKEAKSAGLTVHLIIDAGLTEFHGIPTITCLAIGPDYCDKIDPITGGLKLL